MDRSTEVDHLTDRVRDCFRFAKQHFNVDAENEVVWDLPGKKEIQGTLVDGLCRVQMNSRVKMKFGHMMKQRIPNEVAKLIVKIDKSLTLKEVSTKLKQN